MMVLISGCKDSLVENPFRIIRNRDRKYPTCGVEDNVPGDRNFTGRKGWNGRRVLKDWEL